MCSQPLGEMVGNSEAASGAVGTPDGAA